MKIDELISELEQVKEEHGNLEVWSMDEYKQNLDKFLVEEENDSLILNL